MPIHSDHPDVAVLPRMLWDLVAPATGLDSFKLDFILVRLRDPSGRVVGHYAQGNLRLALGDRLQGSLAEGGGLSRMEILPSTGDDAQGEVLPSPESQLSGCDAGSGYFSGRYSETLTARERDIVGMIGRGLCNKRIARALEISPETVKSHVKHIFLKLAVSTRAEAVSRAGSLGLLPGWWPTSSGSPSAPSPR
jgi:DNA-binding CsgD family transcriptional regulator